MSTARNLAALLDSSGDVVAGALDNAGGGGGWEEITTGTITSNTALLDFTGISTDYNSIRLYMTKLGFSHPPNYTILNASSSNSFSTLLAWETYGYQNFDSNSSSSSGYGNNYDSPYITGENHNVTPNNSNTHYNFTMMIEIHDLQDIPYMTVESMSPVDGTRIGHAIAINCEDRIQSIRIGSGYGTTRYFTAGTYKLYGMK